jgi:hypothetical protein
MKEIEYWWNNQTDELTDELMTNKEMMKVISKNDVWIVLEFEYFTHCWLWKLYVDGNMIVDILQSHVPSHLVNKYWDGKLGARVS